MLRDDASARSDGLAAQHSRPDPMAPARVTRRPVPATAGQNRKLLSAEKMPATIAAAGIVKIQAQTMLPATPQRTAEAPRTLPTPTMAPVIVCVVDTGTPSVDARNSVSAPPNSAQKPPTGLSLVMRWPMVLTMRQPPNMVPSPIAT